WLLTRPSSGRRDLALVVVLSTFAIGPLLYPGVLANSDQPTHLFWLSELDKLFGQGVFYSRWAPDQAYGWGGPAFNYYSPLAWYVAEAFHLAGMGLVEAMKATLAIGIIAGMTGMYLFARTLVGKSGAIVSAIIFGYFPYLVADISIRGELAESLAICLIPATLWSFHKLVAEKKSVFAAPAALLSGLLLLGHNVTALFAFPFLVAYLGFMILKGSPANGRGRALRTSLQQCGYGILGLGLGAGISAFYWLPAIMERGLIWGGLPPRGKANPWGFQAYYMPGEWIYSLHIGDLYAGNGHHHPTGIYFLVGSVAALALIAAFRRGWLRTAFPFFTLLFPALVFLQTEGSAPFWESVPLVAFIQYPWRLLDLVGICLAVIIGGAFSLLANRLEKLSAGWQRRLGVAMAVGVTCLIVISTSMLPLQPQWDTREIDHDDREHNLAAAADMRLKGQFLPISVQPSSPQPKPQGQPELSAKGGLTTLSSTANGFDNKAWLIGLQKQSQVVFDVLYFPGWQVYVDDQRVPTTAQKQTGQVSAPVPAGKHRVELRFEDTPLRRWSDYLSAFSLVPLAVLLVVPVRRRFRLARGRARARTTVAAGGLPDFSE
ncbi:MAG: 6-pyruvoyl-tetrahydropterin synthase-related protein, partial [Chloroflexi bacterium]|nr:6-pyruvoyl-tetrahydropterin synthase-related protein [Chloroflexota bacterium]